MSSNYYAPTSSDGYEVPQVIISADDLLKKAAALKSPHATAAGAEQELINAIVPASAFGTIKGGYEAANRLTTAVQQHIEAIAAMGVSISDFAARVTAAGQLADDAEPATVKASRIPDPFQSTNGS